MADGLRKATLKDLPGIFADIAARPGRTAEEIETREMALRLLCARWADLDPTDGEKFFQLRTEKEQQDSQSAKPNPEPGSGQQPAASLAYPARIFLIVEWALRDAPAAWRHLQALGNPPETARLGGAAGKELVKDDAAKFWQWFQLTGTPPLTEWDSSVNWNAVLDGHLEEITALVNASLSGGPEQPGLELRILVDRLASRRAEKEPGTALAWAAEQPAAVRASALIGAMKTIALRRPDTILDALIDLKKLQTGAAPGTTIRSDSLIQTAMRSMASRDPVGTVKWLQRNQGKLDNTDMPLAMQELSAGLTSALGDGRITLREAFETAGGTGKDFYGNLRAQTFDSMWRALPPAQLASTADWLKAMTPDENRGLALKGLLPAWAELDEAAALQFAAGLNQPDISAGLWDGLLNNHNRVGGGAAESRAEVTEILDRIPPDYRPVAMEKWLNNQFGDGMQEYSPLTDGPGLSKAIDSLPSSSQKDHTAARLAEFWAASDPRAALDWASGQSDADFREKITGAAVESWTKEDAWGASEWLKDQPAGASRDQASRHLAKVLSADEPGSAWTWAADIRDPVIRQDARLDVLRNWRNASAPDAQSALDSLSAGLPPADRQEMQTIINQRQPKP